MDPQVGLSGALLLLLFLHLSPLKGCPTLDLTEDEDNRSEKEPLSCIPEPRQALEPLQQGHSSEEAWTAQQAAPAGGLGPHDNTLQTLLEPQSPKKTPDSGCFGGRRMDRIEFSGLGCKTAKTEAQNPRAGVARLTEEETESQDNGVFPLSKYADQQRMGVGTDEPVTGGPSNRLSSHLPPGPL